MRKGIDLSLTCTTTNGLSLQRLVEHLCRCDATVESVERVELKELGEAHDVIVFSLRGHRVRVV